MTDSTSLIFKAWAWKREGLPDRDKYHRPYVFDDKLTLKQSKNAIGSTVWDGSIVLSRYLQHLGDSIVSGKTVCELGSGAQALPGLVAATLGAKSVVVSDCGDDLLALLQENVESNSETLSDKVTVADYFWGHETSTAFGKGVTFDVILVAECMYVEEAVKPLVDSLKNLSKQTTNIYISYGRNGSCADRFKEAATDSVFTVNEIPMSEWHPEYVDPSCTILHLMRKPKKGSKKRVVQSETLSEKKLERKKKKA